MSFAWWINTLWMNRCMKAANQFARATIDVEGTQRTLLREMLQQNASTAFGKRHAFSSITDVADFQSHVPIVAYEDFAPWVERIAQGEQQVLTAERVELLEPTSGSTSAEKLIPYTAGLRKQFQAGIGAWIFDFYSQRPEVRRGKAYWSISPAFGTRRMSSGGVPIGFDNDDAYLGRTERLLARQVTVAPRGIASLRAGEAFRYLTLLHLLSTRDLSLISIWSPTFLTSLLECLPDWSERLCEDLRQGKVSAPGAERVERVTLESMVPRKAPRRAEELRAIFRSGPPETWAQQIWPQLAVISCWTESSASLYIPALRRWFPDVEIQGKGLLSTEAFISFPSYVHQGSPLAITSHFFEFVEVDTERIQLAHELEKDTLYRVIVTTAGGLYRYDTRDLVRVTGFTAQCPLLRFEGRGDSISDLVGEKLSEPFVQSALAQLFADLALSPAFSLLTPIAGEPPSYRLYLQIAPSTPIPDVHRIAARLEELLQTNPHYRLAIQLRQLSPTTVFLLEGKGPSAWRVYEQHCRATGQRAGAIKPRALSNSSDWELVWSQPGQT